MWNTLAAGFSEFAQVVQQDAQTVITKVQEQTSQINGGAEDDDGDEEQEQYHPSSSPQTKATATSMSPRGGGGPAVASGGQQCLSPTDIVSGSPATLGVPEKLLRMLHSDLETFSRSLSTFEKDIFTPTWLCDGGGDKQGQEEEEAKKSASDVTLEAGAMVLRNSSGVLESFSALFPESQRDNHTLESLQKAVEEADKNPTPIEFFTRYFVRLNMLSMLLSVGGKNPSSSSAAAAAQQEQQLLTETVLVLESNVNNLEGKCRQLQNALDSSEDLNKQLRAAMQLKSTVAQDAELQVRRLEEEIAELKKMQHAPVAAVAENGEQQQQQQQKSPKSGAAIISGSSGASSTVRVDDPEEEDEDGWTDV